MIKSFHDRRTVELFAGKPVRSVAKDVARAAQRKLTMLNRAKSLAEIGNVPGNKLHPLRHERRGQHAVWINDQWRICFVWRDGHAERVEFTDYH
jgi:proteic killer suppression protein